MKNRTAGIQGDTVTLEFVLQHPPAKVWRALTDPDLLTRWLLPVIDFAPEPGAEFRFRTDPQPGWDGVVNCRLLEIEKHRKLSWRWVVGDIDTVVTFTLTATGMGTHLVIEQSGFREDQKRNAGGARYGWKMMGDRLVELLEAVNTNQEDR